MVSQLLYGSHDVWCVSASSFDTSYMLRVWTYTDIYWMSSRIVTSLNRESLHTDIYWLTYTDIYWLTCTDRYWLTYEQIFKVLLISPYIKIAIRPSLRMRVSCQPAHAHWVGRLSVWGEGWDRDTGCWRTPRIPFLRERVYQDLKVLLLVMITRITRDSFRRT